MNFDSRLGFKITKIAFSHNEKLVIIGDENTLAVAEIKSIEEFFNLEMEEIENRFECTILRIEENIDKILIVSNKDLIIINNKGVIYNLGRFNFIDKFKSLKSLKKEERSNI